MRFWYYFLLNGIFRIKKVELVYYPVYLTQLFDMPEAKALPIPWPQRAIDLLRWDAAKDFI